MSRTDQAPGVQTPRQVVASIIADIAADHRVKVGEITGRGRTKRVAAARQAAYAAVTAIGRYSSAQIGRMFDRDHTTVLSGVRRHLERTTQGDAA